MKACLNLFIAGLTGLPAALLLTVYTEASAAICTPPPSGMVGWWRAEGNANDSADGNNGTIAGRGTVTYGPGLVGQALVLDGTHRDRVDLGNPTDLQLQNFTIEAWIKRSSPARNLLRRSGRGWLRIRGWSSYFGLWPRWLRLWCRQ